MAGFDCEFVDQPPEFFQSQCSVCLLVLREPYQVSCCGKSFCRECIEAMEAKNQPCPSCEREEFKSFHNKGLQQPLYGFRVFCSNKESGCAWEGELGQLEQHTELNDKQLSGCEYTKVACVYCDMLIQRCSIKEHQSSQCARRPFTCEMCGKFESTYEDVVTNHAPVCKCRPVSCPNSCGADSLPHQHVEEHVSSYCPLSYVECEFSDAGCDAKVQRKDLPSHLTDNIVTHMSLLAAENRKFKQLLKKQAAEMIRLHPSHVLVPPIDFQCPVSIAKECGTWSSKSFLSYIGGCEIQLKCEFRTSLASLDCHVRISAVSVHQNPKLCVTTVLVSHSASAKSCKVKLELSRNFSGHSEFMSMSNIGEMPRGVCPHYVRNGHLLFRVTSIENLEK